MRARPAWGDVVKLPSGSLLMLVVDVTACGDALTCAYWSNGALLEVRVWSPAVVVVWRASFPPCAC
jgi:hypothetical protein